MERSLYINAENKNGKTTLHFAAKSSHIDIVNALLEIKGIDVNAKDSDGNTPLHLAAIEGHVDVVETLLKIEGIDVNSRNKVGWTVLFSTIFYSYNKKKDLVKTKVVPVIRALLKSGASPLLKCNGNTPISLADEVIKNNDIKHYLEEEAKKVRDVIGAARDDNTNLLDSLLKEGVNVNTTDERGNTILHFAAIFGRKETVEFLLKNQEINVNAKNKDGYTPLLYCAAIFDHTDIVETLLTTQGIDVNAKDNNGNTSLHFFAGRGRIDVVKTLLEKKGMDVNAKDNSGNTPLHVAAVEGHIDVVETLLKRKGMDVNAKDNSGNTPLHVAAVEGHIDIAKALLETKGIDVNAKDNNGNTPLHLAAVEGYIDIVEAMKNKGNSFKQQEYRKDIVAVSAIAIFGATIAVCLFVSGVVAAEPISIMLAVFSIVVVSLEVSGITHDIIRKMEDNLSFSKNAGSKDSLLSEAVGSDLQSPIVNSCCDIEPRQRQH